jgi:hypothetical protein
MSTYYLLNSCTINGGSGAQKYLPGELVDSNRISTSLITGVGGVLWPSSDTVVAAAAAKCQAYHSQKGINELELSAIMFAAASKSLNNNPSTTRQENFAGATLPAKGASVHTQVAAGAPLNVTSAFTVPYPRRALEIVLGVGGTNPVVITVTGTAADGSALSIAQSCAGAGTYEVGNGAQVFETVTSMTSTIDPGGTVDLKTADGFGVGEVYTGTPLVSVDGVVDTNVTQLDAATGGVKSATNPNGTHTYSVRYVLSRPQAL